MPAARPDTDQAAVSPRPSEPASVTLPPSTRQDEASTNSAAAVKRPEASPANGGPRDGTKSPLTR